MAAGTKAHDADSLGIDTPRCRMMAKQPHRALGIQHRHRLAVWRNPIPEHKAAYAVPGQPLANIFALMSYGQMGVPPARTNKHGTAVSFFSGRQKWG